MVPYDSGGSAIPASKKWSSRFPCYQIDFTAVASGKMVATTKRRIRWRFGFPNSAALDAGETGIACRGEEHDVTIVWSIASGKRMILADGHEVHYSTNRGGEIDFSWTMKGNHILKVTAHAAPPLTATPGFRQYDLHIDGQSFFTMPKVFELGIKGPPSAVARVPGVYHPAVDVSSQPSMQYDLRTGQYIRAPRSPEEEEQELQAAIKASLEESRSFLSSRSNSQNASLTQQKTTKADEPDLLGFSEPGPPSVIESTFQGVQNSLSFDSRSEGQTANALKQLQPAPVSGMSQASYSNYSLGTSNTAGFQTSQKFADPFSQQASQSFHDSFSYAPPAAATESFTYAPPPTMADFGVSQSQRHLTTFASPPGSATMPYHPSSDSKVSYGAAPAISPYTSAPSPYSNVGPAAVPSYPNFQLGTPEAPKVNPTATTTSTQQVYSLSEQHVEEPQKQVGLDNVMKKLVNFDDISSGPVKEMTKLTMWDSKSTVTGQVGNQQTLGQIQASKKPIMNAAPSGAMVLHSQQNGNYGGYVQGIQGPPPLQMTTGFGAGAQMGMGYSGFQAPPAYGYQQQMQQPAVQQQQHQQYQQQMQYGYGHSQYAPNNPPS